MFHSVSGSLCGSYLDGLGDGSSSISFFFICLHQKFLGICFSGLLFNFHHHLGGLLRGKDELRLEGSEFYLHDCHLVRRKGQQGRAESEKLIKADVVLQHRANAERKEG